MEQIYEMFIICRLHNKLKYMCCELSQAIYSLS